MASTKRTRKAVKARVPKAAPHKRPANAKHVITRRKARPPMPPMPGPGWKYKQQKFPSGRKEARFWSPGKSIKFRSLKQALQFEALRLQFQGDEGLAWEQFVLHKPHNYHRKPITSKMGPAPGWRPVYTATAGVLTALAWQPPGSSRLFPDLRSARTFALAPASASTKTPVKHAPPTTKPATKSTKLPHVPLSCPNETRLLSCGWMKQIKAKRAQWISPGLKINFKYSKAACEFQNILHTCAGDETQAFQQFRQLKKQSNTPIGTFVCKIPQCLHTRGSNKHNSSSKQTPHKKSRSKKSLSTKEIRQKNLLKQGWQKTITRIHKDIYWTTPELKIQFRHLPPATEFEHIRQSCNGDEIKALEQFRTLKKSLKRPLSNFIRDAASLSMRIANKNQSKSPQDANKNLSKSTEDVDENHSLPPNDTNKITLHRSEEESMTDRGWTTKLSSDERRTLWVSPILKIQFRYRKAAVQFEQTKQDCNGDEARALQQFLIRKRNSNGFMSNFITNLDHAKQVLGSLSKQTQPTTNKASPLQISPPAIITTLSQAHEKRMTYLGWINRPKIGKQPQSWISPEKKIQFRYLKVATEFEIMRQTCQGDETEALGEFRKTKQGLNKPLSCFIYNLPSQLRQAISKAVSQKQSPKTSTLAKSTIERHAQESRMIYLGWTKIAKSNDRLLRWISPLLKIEFRYLKVAHEFEEIRQTYDGNETEAFEQFRRIKNKLKLKLSKFVFKVPLKPTRCDHDRFKPLPSTKKNPSVSLTKNQHTGQAITLRSSRLTNQANEMLGRGWTNKLKTPTVGDNQKRLTWISPMLKIEFRYLKAAFEFETIAKTYDGDENQAFHEFQTLKQSVNKTIHNFVLKMPSTYSAGKSNRIDNNISKECSQDNVRARGHRQASNCPPTGSPRITSRDREQASKTRKGRDILASERQKLSSRITDYGKVNLGPRWRRMKNSPYKYWISPDLGVVFRSLIAAKEMEYLRQQFKNNESKALDTFAINRGSCLFTLQHFILGPRKHLSNHNLSCTSKKCLCSNNKKTSVGLNAFSSKKRSSSHQNQKSIAKIPHRRATKVKYAPPGQRGNSKRSIGRQDQEEGLLSSGWSIARDPREPRKKWISPVMKFEFRYLKLALEFEEFKQNNGGNEAQALEEYKRAKQGMKKKTSLVNDTGTRRKINTPSQRNKRVARGQNGLDKCRYTEAENQNQIENPYTSRLPPEFRGHEAGGSKIVSLRLGCEKQKKKPTFFEEYFPGRVLHVEKQINEPPPERTINFNGIDHVLVSSKARRVRKRPGDHETEYVKLIYIAVKGNDLSTMCIQRELGKLSAFSSMRPEKIVARLAHLQAEARSIHHICQKNIELIKEDGHEGCGFFPEHFFRRNNREKKYDSIQVRIVASQIGLVKGMLLRKRGISRIQVPESMIKAPPSKSSKEDHATVIFKNVFPSCENVQHGKFLDPNLDACESWKKNKRKPLSPMYQRLFIGYGVPKNKVETYAKRSLFSDKLRHAHLKGVADPTGKIPEGKVFISGFVRSTNNKRELFGKCHSTVYVSRSPSVEPTDAKLLSVVGGKTEHMSEDDWSLLCGYSFGTIIFGYSKSKLSAPLPCMIADGDLDGDDYFVCWDDVILGHLLHGRDKLATKSRKLLKTLKLPDTTGHEIDKTTSLGDKETKKWLLKAQDKMLDFPSLNAGGKLVGKLYNLCFEASKKEDGTIDIYDEDACCYARAYKDALDIQKHGGKVYLPERLHDNLPPSQQDFLL